MIPPLLTKNDPCDTPTSSDRRSVLASIATLALTWLWPTAVTAGNRLDPTERALLRQQLRERARDDRGYHREGRHREGRGLAEPRGASAPPGDRRERHGPFTGRPSDGKSRLTPQEREELRFMLRERRRARD